MKAQGKKGPAELPRNAIRTGSSIISLQAVQNFVHSKPQAFPFLMTLQFINMYVLLTAFQPINESLLTCPPQMMKA